MISSLFFCMAIFVIFLSFNYIYIIKQNKQ